MSAMGSSRRASARRRSPLLALALLIGTLLWVELMSFRAAPDTNSSTSSGPPPTIDGSLTAKITRLEKLPDYRIGVSLRVLKNPSGDLLGGLTPADLLIEEDGKRIAPEDFTTAGKQPIRACLVIDRSGSMSGGKLAGAKQAAEAFLDLMQDRSDQMGLVIFDEVPEMPIPISELDPERRAKARKTIADIPVKGGTMLFVALEQALNSMANLSGRRVILALTDGESGDNDRLDAVVKKAKELGIPIFTVGLGSAGEIDVAILERVAKETDAQFFPAASGDVLKDLYKAIGKSLQEEYSFTFKSPNQHSDGQKRNVGITVRQGSVGAMDTRSYFRGTVVVTKDVPETNAKPGDPAPPSLQPTLVIFPPLLLVLGLLFVVPYANLVLGSRSHVVPPYKVPDPRMPSAPGPEPKPGRPGSTAGVPTPTPVTGKGAGPGSGPKMFDLPTLPNTGPVAAGQGTAASQPKTGEGSPAGAPTPGRGAGLGTGTGTGARREMFKLPTPPTPQSAGTAQQRPDRSQPVGQQGPTPTVPKDVKPPTPPAAANVTEPCPNCEVSNTGKPGYRVCFACDTRY